MIGKKISDKSVSDLFASLAEHDRYVFLDTSLPDRENRESLLFTSPLKQLEYRLGEDRAHFFDQLFNYLNRGYYLAGWFGYEFLHDHLAISCNPSNSVAANLGVYNSPILVDHTRINQQLPIEYGKHLSRSYELKDLSPSMDEQRYCRAIRRILEYIAAGDTYQVNYTFKFSFEFKGSAVDLYTDLRRSQPVPYGCCIKDGDQYVMSFSPELFFRADQGRIYAKPMKGTMKRGRTNAEDSELQYTLKNDEKNRSENVMIVDLLRNDLSRLVEATGGGFVNVASLFDVERYQSVLQMTSSIVADRLSDETVSPKELLKALFPCGSVTGAPKIRTMEIIDELEEQPRGVYTGAIGYFSPDGKSVFNVPIRTVVLDGGRGEMGIGSGIVADSTPEDEWQECLLKANFLTNPLPEFSIIETMFHSSHDGYLFFDDHVTRLKRSAAYFNFAFEKELLLRELERFGKTLAGVGNNRVRLALSSDGTIGLTAGNCGSPLSLELPDHLDAQDGPLAEIDFADQRTDSSQLWLFHKTTRRTLYNEAYIKAQNEGLFDLIFCNERNEVTEGCIANIFILKDNIFYTPSLSCGLLDGVMRKQILGVKRKNPVIEKVLHKEDVLGASRIYLCNSVRGVVPVRIRTK